MTKPEGTKPKLAAVDPNAKPKESKRAKFERIINKRVSKVLKQIAVIANMGGGARYNYEFSPDDVGRIGNALDEATAKLRHQMIAPGHQLDVEWDVNKA